MAFDSVGLHGTSIARIPARLFVKTVNCRYFSSTTASSVHLSEPNAASAKVERASPKSLTPIAERPMSQTMISRWSPRKSAAHLTHIPIARNAPAIISNEPFKVTISSTFKWVSATAQ